MSLTDKVYQEYLNNAILAERRYQFLLKMPKALRPYNHEEVLKDWQTARQQFKTKQICITPTNL